MIKINENFEKIQASYLFSTVAKKVAEFQKNNPDAKIIKLGIGDVTRPLPKVCINAMKKAADEMGDAATFRGYGPEQGYDFLRNAIVENEYKGLGIEADEIFVSDGAKCDCGNIVDIFAVNNKVAVTDPVYPVYVDTNVMSGRTGKYKDGKYEGLIYMPMTEENNFKPELPKEVPDIIYLCFPNNPTGTVLTKDELKVWVDYAKENKSIILFDAAYCAFISEPNIPKSIYEVEGAKDVAIEFKSYSKTAGFTGVRCGYAVIPKTVYGYDDEGKKVELNNVIYDLYNGTSLEDEKTIDNMFGDRMGYAIDEHTIEKPKCALIGEDGNIFNLMGIASRTLKRNGMQEEAKEMCNRITNGAKSYDEALMIIDEYVEIIDKEEMEEDEY